jgi:hypothetical protein
MRGLRSEGEEKSPYQVSGSRSSWRVLSSFHFVLLTAIPMISKCASPSR